MKWFPILMGLMIACDSHAQTEASKTTPNNDDICAKVACRKGGFEVALFVEATHFTTVPVNQSPYVTPEGDILIFPGETIAYQFSIKDGVLSTPIFYKQFASDKHNAMPIVGGTKLIKNPIDTELPSVPMKDNDVDSSQLPPNTLLIAYGQFNKVNDQSRKDTGMLMTFHSNLPMMKLDAKISIVKKGAYVWYYTSTCPIKNALLESWPENHGPVFLSKFRLLPEGAKFVCE